MDARDRYLPVLGPNSKQLWVYDEVEGMYIDPPAAVLDEIDAATDDIDEAERLLLEMVVDEAAKPDGGWLMEREYWYDGDI